MGGGGGVLGRLFLPWVKIKKRESCKNIATPQQTDRGRARQTETERGEEMSICYLDAWVVQFSASAAVEPKT